MSSSFAFRSALSDTPAYVPGRPPAPVPGLTAYKLSSNEHHMDPLPAVRQAAADALAAPQTYPDPAVAALTDELAAFHGVEPQQVVVTAGASEALAALAAITLEPGLRVVYPWPSFEMYPQRARFAGAEISAVPLTPDGRHDLDAMAEAIDDATRLVLLCSPNNPTGPVLGQDEFDAFMEKVPADVVTVLDEAYIEFAQVASPEGMVDAEAAQRRWPNLVVVRTFSKAHGLAGLRVGYAFGHPEIILEMRKSVAPFSVSQPAQEAARTSLAMREDVLTRAKEVGLLRDELIAGLRGIGLDVPDSYANFVWVPAGERAQEFAAACGAQGLAVRALTGGVRVSVGPQEAMERIVEVAAAVFGAEENAAEERA